MIMGGFHPDRFLGVRAVLLQPRRSPAEGRAAPGALGLRTWVVTEVEGGGGHSTPLRCQPLRSSRERKPPRDPASPQCVGLCAGLGNLQAAASSTPTLSPFRLVLSSSCRAACGSPWSDFGEQHSRAGRRHSLSRSAADGRAGDARRPWPMEHGGITITREGWGSCLHAARCRAQAQQPQAGAPACLPVPAALSVSNTSRNTFHVHT